MDIARPPTGWISRIRIAPERADTTPSAPRTAGSPPVPAHAELKLHLHFAKGGAGDTDVYARVVRSFEREGRALSCLEFTSISVQGGENIRHFVQMLLQGGGDR